MEFCNNLSMNVMAGGQGSGKVDNLGTAVCQGPMPSEAGPALPPRQVPNCSNSPHRALQEPLLSNRSNGPRSGLEYVHAPDRAHWRRRECATGAVLLLLAVRCADVNPKRFCHRHMGRLLLLRVSWGFSGSVRSHAFSFMVVFALVVR